jgi:hypothetical protein
LDDDALPVLPVGKMRGASGEDTRGDNGDKKEKGKEWVLINCGCADKLCWRKMWTTSMQKKSGAEGEVLK